MISVTNRTDDGSVRSLVLNHFSTICRVIVRRLSISLLIVHAICSRPLGESNKSRCSSIRSDTPMSTLLVSIGMYSVAFIVFTSYVSIIRDARQIYFEEPRGVLDRRLVVVPDKDLAATRLRQVFDPFFLHRCQLV